jgi:SET domain-containing protein
MLFSVDDKTVIDATRWGNSARFINHSCTPNCEAIEEEGRIFIETIKKVALGEELTYDYNLILEERHTPAVKRAHACFCGTRRCRGTLLGVKR